MKASGTQASGKQANGARATSTRSTKTARAATPSVRDPTGLLKLQRTVGNRAVRSLLDGAAGADAAAVGAPPWAMPVRLRTPVRLQGRLAVGPADDEFEREAERVADAVMAAAPEPHGGLAIRPASPRIQRTCTVCSADSDDTCTCIQRKAEPAAPAQPPAAIADHPPPGLAARLAVLGGGRPLSSSEREFFEPRFGERFADVRIHAGAAASAMARDLRARAFTFGRDIVMGAGQDVSSTRGRRLLAHELTHTLQQARNRISVIQRDHDPCSPLDRSSTPAASTPSSVPRTEILIEEGPLRSGVLGAPFPLPAYLQAVNMFGGGVPSFTAEIGPRALLGGVLENIVLKRSIRSGTPPYRLTDPEAEQQIRLIRPFVRIDPKTGRLGGLATLSIDDSAYPPSHKGPTEVDVTIKSSEIGRFTGRLGYGPLQADLKLSLTYDTQHLETAAKTAFAPEGMVTDFEAAFRDIVKQTMPTVPFEAGSAALEALYRASVNGNIDAAGFASRAIALLGKSVPAGIRLDDLRRVFCRLYQELIHPGYNVSGTVRLLHVPITKFGAHANTTRPGGTSSLYAVGAIIAPPGSITSVSVPAFGGTYSYRGSHQRLAATGALLPSLSLDAVNRGAPFVDRFPVYAFAEVSYANKISKSVELGVRLTIQTSTSELFGTSPAPPTDPVDRFKLARDQYKSLQAGTDAPLVPNAGVVVFANW